MPTNRVEITYGRIVEVDADGNIDHNAIKAFTRGQCHALALALHKLSDLPLAGVYPRGGYYSGSTPVHVLVQLPNGSYLDIQGPGAENRWEDWGDGDNQIKPVSKRSVQGFHRIDYVKHNVKAALPFAKRLIEAHLETKGEHNEESHV